METGLYISIGALIVAFLGLVLNGRKETRSDAATLAQIGAKLDSAVNGINDLRVEVRTMRESINDHSERLARVEAKADSNAHRLDVLESE